MNTVCNEPTASFTADNIMVMLNAIALHIGEPTTLCLIGSAASILAGQPNRASNDIDIWAPASRFNRADMDAACDNVGFLFDPKGEVEPNVGYLQVVQPGIVQVGKFTETEEIFSAGNLTVVRPPMANIVASKLVRGSAKDLEDIAFILSHFGVSKGEVASVVKKFPKNQRDTATENLIYLDVLGGRS